jgi:prevent-host-death family protein
MPPATATVSATHAKNEFGSLLERAIQGGTVVITKHNTPKAVLISIDDFERLSGPGRASLDAFTRECDAMLARMQTPAARKAMDALFHATPEQMGKAAVEAARRRAR